MAELKSISRCSKRGVGSSPDSSIELLFPIFFVGSDVIFDLARVILGLIFFLFGLNGFFHWWPLPPMNPQMSKFNDDLVATKIIMPVVKGFEIVFGFLLLINYFTFFALLALLPISFFIVLSHLYFNFPRGLVMALTMATLTGVLIFHHWERFIGILG